jgi:hypothetical protein
MMHLVGEGTGHYSFDFAQQIHYPSNPLQPGQIYFETPRKCGIFGVMCEAVLSKVSFLIDESVKRGKHCDKAFTFFNYGLVLVKNTCIFMLITVVDKTKIPTFCGT